MADFLTEDVAINCGVTKESIEESLIKLTNLTSEERRGRISGGINICLEHQWVTQANKMRDIYGYVLSEFQKNSS